MNLIVKLLINALAIFLVARYIPGISLADFSTAVVVALVLGLINVLIKPILSLLALPITIVTLGLFSLVINALMFWLAAEFVPGFDVSGFVPALLGSIIVSAVVWVGETVLGLD